MEKFHFSEKIICPGDPTATPERVEQYKQYYPIKYKICKEQYPKRIAEIGIRAGYSAWTFLQACPNATYIGFDANNETHGGQGANIYGFFEWAKKILLPYDAYLIELDTQTVDDLMILNIDFFHIDGDHTAEGVYHDLNLAWKATKKNGLLLVDDYDYLPEVQKGVDSWIAKMDTRVKWEYRKSLRGEILITKLE